MNRYLVPASRNQSKATASTLCQKCLKRDSYECKSAAQERPYASRPSRTQQLFNPKLVPKLSADVPNDLLRKKGVADEALAKKAEERGRKRNGHKEEGILLLGLCLYDIHEHVPVTISAESRDGRRHLHDLTTDQPARASAGEQRPQAIEALKHGILVLQRLVQKISQPGSQHQETSEPAQS